MTDNFVEPEWSSDLDFAAELCVDCAGNSSDSLYFVLYNNHCFRRLSSTLSAFLLGIFDAILFPHCYLHSPAWRGPYSSRARSLRSRWGALNIAGPHLSCSSFLGSVQYAPFAGSVGYDTLI